MRVPPVQRERVKPLNDLASRRGKYVLYWMQQSQRERYNHALEYAIGRANDGAQEHRGSTLDT